MNEVIELTKHPRYKAPEPKPVPRAKFGLREPWLRSDNLTDLSKPHVWAEPKRNSFRTLSDLAREYGDSAGVEPGVRNLFNPKNVDPTLRIALAAQITALSSQAIHLADVAKSYGHLPEAIDLNAIAGDLEVIACHIDGDDHVE